MKNLTLVKEFGHSGRRKWDFYLRFLLYVMVFLDMPQIEPLWVQPFEPPFFFSTPPERYWHRKIGREILNVFAMLFSIDDTLSARASIQVPLFVIVMKKCCSHQGIYSQLLLWIDPKTKNDQKTTGISISKSSVKSEGKNQLIFDCFLVLSNVPCES